MFARCVLKCVGVGESESTVHESSIRSQVGRAICVTSQYVAKDAIRCKATANDRANAGATLDSMETNASAASRCPAASTERKESMRCQFDSIIFFANFMPCIAGATFHLSVFATKAGTASSVQNVSLFRLE